MNLPVQPCPPVRVERDIEFEPEPQVRRTPPSTRPANRPQRRFETVLVLAVFLTGSIVLFTHGPFAAAVAAYLVLFSGIMGLALWAWALILSSSR